MNEKTISTPTRSGLRTFAHTLALEAAKLALPMALRVPGSLKSVADQLIRSVSSVALNLAEAEGRIGRQRVNGQRIAYGEALEASTALEILLSAGVIDSATTAKALDLLDQVRAITWRLMHPR